jgi:hypothetical protein
VLASFHSVAGRVSPRRGRRPWTAAWRVPVGVKSLWGMAGALWLAFALSTVLRPMPGPVPLWDDGVDNAVYVLATVLCALRARRGGREHVGWWALAMAMALSTGGEV